jgi:hypothetical protein
VIERHQLADMKQIRRGKESVRPESLRQLLAPACRRPREVADVAAAEGRQVRGALGLFFAERGPQRLERLCAERKPLAACADVAVAAERAFEEEGAFERSALFWGAAGDACKGGSSVAVLVEETEDAEGRQQVTGKFYGGCRASKAGSGSGSSCGHRNGCARPDQAV